MIRTVTIRRLVGAITGLLIGAMIGIFIGFTLFDPDADIWALLGMILALIVGAIGLTESFWRRVGIPLGIILGIYFGALLGLALTGWAEHSMYALFRSGGLGAVMVLGGGIIGGGLGATRSFQEDGPLYGALIGFVFGAFLGSYLLGVVLGVGEPSFPGQAPTVILSGLVGGVAGFALQRRSSTR